MTEHVRRLFWEHPRCQLLVSGVNSAVSRGDRKRDVVERLNIVIMAWSAGKRTKYENKDPKGHNHVRENVNFLPISRQ